MVTLSKTGNSELDEQHSVMQGCLSDLVILLDGASDLSAVLSSLEALSSYAEWHFAYEERLLKRTHYPDRPQHVAEHRAIVDQLNRLRSLLSAGNRDTVGLISIVTHWLADHVNNEDMKLANYLRDIGPVQSGAAESRQLNPKWKSGMQVLPIQPV